MLSCFVIRGGEVTAPNFRVFFATPIFGDYSDGGKGSVLEEKLLGRCR